MKKKHLKIAALAASTLAFTAGNSIAAADLTRTFGDQEMKIKFFGFTQVTAEAGEGLDATNDGLRFGADRVRLGFKTKMGKSFGKLHLDFQKTGSATPSPKFQMHDIIKDAEFGYKFMNELSVKVGQFKTPVGMDFNIPGKNLNITKRGMEKKLVLERALGAMVSGRKIGDMFSYDIGVFNPATRSSAVSSGVLGDGLAYAVRAMLDVENLHAEVSYGSSEEAGGAGTEDYSVVDAALSYIWQDLTLKAEYISGEDIKGVTGDDEEVWYLHAGYSFSPMFEGVVRHYQAKDDSNDRDLGNTYVGLNIFLNEKAKLPARIQLNYVVTSGDDGLVNAYNGTAKGYMDDVILAQFQAAF